MLDSEFRMSISNREQFVAANLKRKKVLNLENIRHEIDGKTILEHTRLVLTNLRTDKLSKMSLDGTTFNVPELMRMVALYHDLDKSGEEHGDRRSSKTSAAEEAIREIEETDPEFFKIDADKKVFATLLQTCDYFGYNINLLSRTGAKFRDGIKTLLEKKLMEPLEALDVNAIDIDWEDFLLIQYEISRADTMGIEPFRRNVGQIDLLFQELNKAFAY